MWRAVLVLSLLAAVSAGDWTLSVSGASVTLAAVGGASNQVTKTIAAGLNTATFPDATVSWYDWATVEVHQSSELPAMILAANLPALSQFNVSVSYPVKDRVWRVTDNLFVITHGDNLPYVTPFGVFGDTVFVCNTTLSASRQRNWCWSVTTGASPQFLASLTIGLTSSLTVTPSGLAVDATLLGLVAAQSVEFDTISADISWIADKTWERRQHSRVAVGFLWFFVAASIFAEMFLLSALQSWVAPLWKREPHSVYVWTLALSLLCIILAVTTGLNGLVVVVILGLLYIFGIYLVYCCVREKKIMSGKDDTVKAIGPVAGGAAAGAGKAGEGKEEKKELAPRTGSMYSSTVAPVGANGSVNSNGGSGGGGGGNTSEPTAPAWSVYPDKLGGKQRSFVTVTAVAFLTCFCVCVAIFGMWRVDDYFVFSRQTQRPMLEFIPATVYVFDGYATRLQIDSVFFDVSTEWCGTNYRKELPSVADKHKHIEVAFIEQYAIDMTIFNRTSYLQYSSVNDWFTRELAAGVRPVSEPDNDRVIVSPADARLMAFNSLPVDARIWIKGEDFSATTLVGEHWPAFDGGALVIVRLAPQDYHRFHSPVNGTVLEKRSLSGTLHSVNADGMTSKNDALYNKREVLILGTAYGRVAFVAIGATCVGSVVSGVSIGQQINRGQEVGFFQFGGSTVALLFEKDAMSFDDDLLYHATNRVETLAQVNQRIGVFRG